MIVLQLPYPPSANRMWARTRRGTRLTDEYEAWLGEAGWLAASQKQEPIRGPYVFIMNAVAPDNRRRDLDNLIKPVSDLLQRTGLIEDDRLCRRIEAQWVTTGHGVTVEVRRAE